MSVVYKPLSFWYHVTAVWSTRTRMQPSAREESLTFRDSTGRWPWNPKEPGTSRCKCIQVLQAPWMSLSLGRFLTKASCQKGWGYTVICSLGLMTQLLMRTTPHTKDQTSIQYSRTWRVTPRYLTRSFQAKHGHRGGCRGGCEPNKTFS